MESGGLVNGFSSELHMNNRAPTKQEVAGVEGDRENKDDKVSGPAYPSSLSSSKDEYGSQYSSYNSLEQARINAQLDRINRFGFEEVRPDVDDEMASEEKRLETFKQWPQSSTVNPRDLAKAGFYLKGPGDLVSCFSCDLQLKDWVDGDNPLEEHKRLKPNCIFILETERENYAVTCHGEPVTSEITSGNDLFRQMPGQLPHTRPYSDVNTQYKYRDQNVPPYSTSSVEFGRSDPRFQSLYSPPYLSSVNQSSHQTAFPELYLRQQQGYNDHHRDQNPSVTQESSLYRSEQFISPTGTTLPSYNPRLPFPGHQPINYTSVTSQNWYTPPNRPYLQTPSQFMIRPMEPRMPAGGYRRESDNYRNYSVTQESLSPAPGRHPYLPNCNIPVLHPMPSKGPHIRTEDTLHITSPTDLQSEHHRMTTFVDWPEDCPVRPWELASAGFYYLGNQDNVKCYKCGVALRNWEPDDTPWEEHKKWSSDCPLVKAHYQGKHAHQPVEDQEQVQPRLSTASQAKKPTYQKTSEPHRYPFHNQGRNQMWPKQAGDWNPPQLQRFQAHSSAAEVQMPTSQSYSFSHQGRIQDYPQTSYRGRDNEHLPLYQPAPWRNVQAQFPSVNESQRNPQSGTVSHDQAVSTCAASIATYNSAYSTGQVVSNPSENPSQRDVPSNEDSSLESEDNLSARDVMRAMEMGFTREAIDEAIAIKTQRTGNGFTNLDDLMQALLDNQNNVISRPQTASSNTARSCTAISDPESQTIDRNERNLSQREQAQLNFALAHSISYHQDQTPAPKQALKRSNSAPPGSSTNSAALNESVRELERTQEERLICKICMDAEVGIVFLPCGHISCCPNCASGLDLCPMCRMSIQKMHRTFLS